MVFALPMGLLTATLLVFGRFSADQELTARAPAASACFRSSRHFVVKSFLLRAQAWINTDLGRVPCGLQEFAFPVRAELVNANCLKAGLFMIFRGYIFTRKRINGGNLQGVMIFKLENETNVETTLRAPRVGSKPTWRTNTDLHLFDARTVTLSGPRVESPHPRN